MFKPVNRHILIDTLDKDEAKPTIVLPDDYKPKKEKHATATVLSTSDDVRFELSQGTKIIVDQSMIEQIVLNDTTYNVVLDNYVVGIVQK